MSRVHVVPAAVWQRYRRCNNCLGVFGGLTFAIAAVAMVLGLIFPLKSSLVQTEVLLMDQFAYTMTQKDIRGNVALFAPNATIDFHRLMRFLVPPTGLSADQWAFQLETFLPTFRTNHMTYSNFNVTRINGTDSHAFALGYYTWTFDSINAEARLTTVVSSYTAEFYFKQSQIYRASVLPNATNTVISSELFGSGVAPPGPLLSKRNNNNAETWQVLLTQIDALVAAGQTDQARAICNTLQYQMLADEFDPQRSNTTLACNTFPSSPNDEDLGIATVNQIPPFMRDFTIIGGFGISITGGSSSLTIDNHVQISAPEEFVVFIMDGSTYFEKVNQSANTVWAGPTEGMDDKPVFRLLVEEDVPLLNAANALYGILPIHLGGTGSNASFAGNQIIVSSSDGQSLVEGHISINLQVPTDLFQVTSPPVTFNGSHVFEVIEQQANHLWAGPTFGASDIPTFRLLVENDIPLLNASEKLTGVLGLSNGGTGNSGPFAGQRIILSTTSSLEEGTLLAGDGIGISIVGTVVTIENTGILWVPEDLFVLTTNKSFVAKDQTESHVWIGNTFGPPTFRALEKADLPLLNVSVEEGGTGRTQLFQSYRVLISNGAGDEIVEAGILNDGDFLIGQSGGMPLVGQITAAPGGEIIVTPSAGMIELGLGEVLSTTDLTVTGSTFLGTNTSCVNPIHDSCYDISNQQCASGSLHPNCVPDSFSMIDLTVQTLTVLNSTILGTVIDQEYLNVTNLMVDSFTCSSINTISSDCFDISGKMCSMGNALSESCIPASLVMFDMDVTNNLTVNNVVCNAGALHDDCIPLRVGTIAGIDPNSATFNFDIQAGSGISIMPISNGLLISNAGQLSVPNDLFVASGLSFSTKPQMANYIWAGPASGSPAVPAFRPLQIADLPPLEPHQFYYGAVGPTNLTGAGSLLIDDSNIGELILNGLGITNLLAPTTLFSVDLSIANQASLQFIPQIANTVFAGPDGLTGLPTFRALELTDLPIIDRVTSVALDAPADIFNVSGSPVTSTGTLALDFKSQPKHSFLAGTDTLPTFRPMEIQDLPTLPVGQFYISNGTQMVGEPLQAGLASVGLSVPSAEFTVSNSPLISDGTLTIEKVHQLANTFWAGPVSGTAEDPVFRSLDIQDLQSLNLEDGELLIGNSGGVPSAAHLIAGSNVVISNGPGGITISASVNTSMIGTVMSVGLNAPNDLFSVSGSPITSSGTLGFGVIDQAAKTLWMGPISGSAAPPAFRSLEYSDLPTGIPINLTVGPGLGLSGSFELSNTMSVGLSISGPLFSVTNSPVTAAGGTLTAQLLAQNAKSFFAAPTGSAGLPSFRSIELADLPPLNNGQLYMGQGGNVVASGLAAGTGISISNGPGVITISSTGEANNGQNVGTAGVGVFKQKSGSSLQFKKLHSPDGSIDIVDDTINSKINLQTASGFFGANVQMLRRIDTTSTTSSSWSTRQTLTTPNLSVGTYRVDFTTIHNAGNPNTTPGVRLVLNGDPNYFFGGQIFAKQQVDANPVQRESYHGADFFVGNGVNTIELQFSRVSGNQPVEILFSSISIWRVS